MRAIRLFNNCNYHIISGMDLQRFMNSDGHTSFFGLSQCIVALNKKMKSNQSNTNSSRGNFQITDYVLTVILSQGVEFHHLKEISFETKK